VASRFALPGRLVRRQPAFSAVAILTLAIGIGATTAVFTIVYGVLLRPLPYRDPTRLTMVFYGHHGQVSPWLSPLDFRDYVVESDVFVSAAAVAPITANVTGTGEPERASHYDVRRWSRANRRACARWSPWIVNAATRSGQRLHRWHPRAVLLR
jgi:hypothetical protein